MSIAPPDPAVVTENVRAALAEDIGEGDISAQLVPESSYATAQVLCREPAVLCGTPWVEEVFRQFDADVAVNWCFSDGDEVPADAIVLSLEGRARSLLTGERCALNFLQFLSATASRCRYYARLVEGTGVRLLDTRKTVPGLRIAQKYAVRCGGCHNHRIGLFDAFLIKENHIAACGSISAAIERARQQAPGKRVEVEVESLEQLEQAINSKADTVLLDNFSVPRLVEAVKFSRGRCLLEASGGISEETLRPVAETGVDCISIGGLTKDVVAIDLSMRFVG